MPCHRRRTGVVTFHTQVRARLWSNPAVRIVASRAIESGRAADLVRVGDLLLHGIFGVTLVARLGLIDRHGAPQIPI